VKRIAELMKHDTGGDPMTGLKWTRKTTRKVARELKKIGVHVSAKTVARLLKAMGYSLRVNHKKIASGSKNPPTPEERNRQFEYISEMREAFAQRGSPIISIDTKKKELIGNFKNDGKAWEKEALDVNDHDFRSDGVGLAIPFGVYDTQANLGYVSVGNSAETPRFVIDSIVYFRQACVKRPPGRAMLAAGPQKRQLVPQLGAGDPRPFSSPQVSAGQGAPSRPTAARL